MKKIFLSAMTALAFLNASAVEVVSPDYGGKDGMVGKMNKVMKYSVTFSKKDERSFRIVAEAATGWKIIEAKVTSSDRWILTFSEKEIRADSEPVEDIKKCPDLFTAVIEGKLKPITITSEKGEPAEYPFEIEAHSYMYWIEPQERTLFSSATTDNYFKAFSSVDGADPELRKSDWRLIPYAGGKEISIQGTDTIIIGANASHEELKSLLPGRYRVLAEDSAPPKDQNNNPVANQKDEANLNIIKLDIKVTTGIGDLDNGEASGVPENKETSANSNGIYVLVNWDDDDADGKINDSGDGWISPPVPDLMESPVANEDNLVGIKLELDPVIADAIVSLELTGEKDVVKLWKSPSKDGEIQLNGGKKEWNLTNPTELQDLKDIIKRGIFIEGTKESSSEGASTIQFSYKGLSDEAMETRSLPLTVVMAKVGAASYREDEIKQSKELGYAGLITRFKGGTGKDDILSAKNYELITMQNSPDKCLLCSWSEYKNKNAEYWGEYETPSISYVDRLKVMLVAKYIKNRLPDIKSEREHALKPFKWNGKLSTISSLSSDGLIEVCHEWNGIPVWGNISGGQTNYSILTYQSEHIKSNEGNPHWNWYLFPATQCAKDSKFKGELWDTTLVKSVFFKPGIGEIRW